MSGVQPFLRLSRLLAKIFLAIFVFQSSLNAQENLFNSYVNLTELSQGENSIQTLSLPEIKNVFSQTSDNPVSRLIELSKYDPTGAVGFCFGRSMTAHIVARKNFRVSPSRILKLFIVGDLRSNPSTPEWRFHVTTVVPVSNQGKTQWYSVDPIMNMPLKMADWIRQVRQGWDSWQSESNDPAIRSKGIHQAKLYLVNAHAVLPDIRNFVGLESGSDLIDLTFNPDEKNIERSLEWPHAFETEDSIYFVNSAQSQKYFLVGQPGSSQFTFDGLQVGPDWIGFNGYFKDLFGTFGTKHQFLVQPSDSAPTSKGLTNANQEKSQGQSLGFNPSRLRKNLSK